MAEETLDTSSGGPDSEAVLAAIMNKTTAPEAKVDDEPEAEVDVAPEEKTEEAEPEAEVEEREIENLDDYTVDVTVDGKPVTVSLKELKSAYSGNKYIEANITKAVESRKAAETQAETLYHTNQQVLANLGELNKILAAQSQPNIDWAKLKETDPAQYLFKREEMRELQEKQFQVQREAERVGAEQARLAADAQKTYLDGQAQELVKKLPILSDAEAAPKLMATMTEGAIKFYGYAKPEVDAIVDHRAMLILHDAVQYRLDQDRKSVDKPKSATDVPAKKVLLRPSGAPATQQTNQRKLDASVLARARKTGSVDDVAAFLTVRKKG